MSQIPKSNFQFLKDLSENNNRDWFAQNKTVYEREHSNTIGFADTLLDGLNKHDLIATPSGKKSLFRIYRDVRFGKDKSPYKSHWSGSFKRATGQLRGGYYFHIEPGNSVVAGGFWGPNAEDIKRIRQEISADSSELRAIINSKLFKEHFGHLEGQQVKTAPKGFGTQDPEIDLLRYKQFLLTKKFKDQDVLSSNFAKQIDDTFKAMRPFFDFMSNVLTSNANGEDI